MDAFYDAAFTHLSIHKLGNKVLDEPLILSDTQTILNDDALKQLLVEYFLHPFIKANEIFRFTHNSGDRYLNEIFVYAQRIFADVTSFHCNSKLIAAQLYEATNHPKIKAGELYCCYFEKLPIEGQMVNAIGIFKSESKEPYLSVNQVEQGFNINYVQEAINIKKLDKGCIIFNTDEGNGYKISVIDQLNKTEAAYWVDDFLQLKIINNGYNQTNTMLNIYKDFVKNEMDSDFDMGKVDKIDLLNRSIKYFKENDNFNLHTFGAEVINNEQGIASFKAYKENYEAEFETDIPNGFTIHEAAVKKQARVFKSVLKLDKNFHIYIHGNNDLIEKGFDEKTGLHFYKVYFKEEV